MFLFCQTQIIKISYNLKFKDLVSDNQMIII